MSVKIGIGLIGCGWAAGIHARGYQQAADLGAQVVCVAVAGASALKTSHEGTASPLFMATRCL